ncbi:13226_t:CDS:2, partial [Dentiscutata erythropus]
MKSQSSFSFQKTQQERLEKAQIRVIERDILPSSSSVYAEAYTEVYLDDKEVGEIDDGNCSTQWNSKYRFWERLLKLKDAIIWLEYSTLSVIYPIIELLKFEFTVDPNLPLVDDNYDLNDEYESNIDSGSEDESSKDEEDYTQDTLNIQLTIAQ